MLRMLNTNKRHDKDRTVAAQTLLSIFEEKKTEQKKVFRVDIVQMCVCVCANSLVKLP